ncbi:L,D-transpeptidase family protein [Pseudonocardia lacus]|uniref:L,D-transpeptidase family protein n=1 Tax=Pseudonocardia lacus TaxID=2835865 RepID=UPI001BDC5CF0|nr:L,D-transpeptidase family protein [Pseudonocardia lacus]
MSATIGKRVLRAAALCALVLVLGTGCAAGPDPPAPAAAPTTVPTTLPTTLPTTAPATSTAAAPAPTTTPVPATSTSGSATSQAPAPAAPAALRRGDSGPEVLALQERLSGLGYWLGTPDGSFGSLTQQAVYALQGAAGLERDGSVGPATRAALDAGTRPTARSASGAVTEIDRDAGLISFVRDGQVQLVLHTSTGTFETYRHEGRRLLADTPEGRFGVTWAHDGWRDGALGRLYRPRYFHPDGIAVHGYPSVPAYPASHGCARVSGQAMDMIWARDLMPRRSEVWVY